MAVTKMAGIKLISGINLIAAILHLLFWGLALSHLLPRLSDPIPASVGTTIGIGVGDLLWAVPLLLLGSFALYRKKMVGWLAAQAAYFLYFYSMTFVVVRDLISGKISPGTYIFMPFALFAIWATYFLWKNRTDFH